MRDIFRQTGAKAIWKDDKKLLNRYVKFQVQFTYSGTDKVLIYICADNEYEVYINGNLASFGQYEDFPNSKIYNCHDITEFVREGENLVSVLAYSIGKNLQCRLSGLPMVIFSVMAGDTCLLVSNNDVRCTDETEYKSGENIERITAQLSYNIALDMRLDDGYRSENVSSRWSNAVEVDDSEITYALRPVSNLVIDDINCGKLITQGAFGDVDRDVLSQRMLYAPLAFRNFKDCFEKENSSLVLKNDNTYWLLDLGAEAVGYFSMDIEAEDGAVIDVAYGEHLKDMRVRSYTNNGLDNYAFSITCKKGRQSIIITRHRIAGRYLQIFAHGGIKKIHRLGLCEVHYPMAYSCPLHLNDGLFNKIYEVCQKTLELCVHSHYEDCPQREQALYALDSRNQMLTGYYTFGETAMAKASIELFAKGQQENGLFELCVPGEFERTIPYFALAWICAVHEYILFSGETGMAVGLFDNMKKALEFFEIDECESLIPRKQGYKYWNFYEWTDRMDNWDNDDDIKYDAPLNAFYIKTLSVYSELCNWCDRTEEAKMAQLLHDKMCKAFHKTFYCCDKGAYKSYVDGKAAHFAQLTQAWALWAGCVPEENKKQVRAAVIDKDLVEASLSHLIFCYDVLMEDPEVYSDYVLKDIEKQWGFMLYNGATSFWETIDGADAFGGEGASLCHGWSATPAYIFWRYIMGIYPKKPGFSEIEIKPCCRKDITAEGKLMTPLGILNVSLSNGKTTIYK